LAQDFFKHDTFRLLILSLPKLDLGVTYPINQIYAFFFYDSILFLFFDFHDILPTLYWSQARQNATHVIANLQRQRVSGRLIASEYLENNLDLMDILLPGLVNKMSFCCQEVRFQIYFSF
jgi:calcium binding protein 39